LELAPSFSPKVRAAVLGALCSRPEWARLFLEAVDAGGIRKEQVTSSNLLAIQGLHDAGCDALLNRHWSRLKQSSAENEATVAQVRKLLAGGKGDASIGRDIFKTTCAVCHTLNK